MKKIIGVLGIAVIAMAMFFNTTILVNNAGNDLSTLLTLTDASAEFGDPNCEYALMLESTNTTSGTVLVNGEPCYHSVTETSTDCIGTGSLCCLEGSSVESIITSGC